MEDTATEILIHKRWALRVLGRRPYLQRQRVSLDGGRHIKAERQGMWRSGACDAASAHPSSLLLVGLIVWAIWVRGGVQAFSHPELVPFVLTILFLRILTKIRVELGRNAGLKE